ncbi:MAG: ATP-dependent Clp protease adaptor ClpS [Campylobacterota bacterium]|nr:ATP-dependent Clp protease adaptor ClpS [Campylobacterota bacterium]
MPKINESAEVSLEIQEPDMYQVLLHNDDYTSMDFVVEILMKVFHKNIQDAETIMIMIHEKGSAICGLYSYEIAQTKAQQVKKLARQNEFPLLATIEKDL